MEFSRNFSDWIGGMCHIHYTHNYVICEVTMLVTAFLLGLMSGLGFWTADQIATKVETYFEVQQKDNNNVRIPSESTEGS